MLKRKSAAMILSSFAVGLLCLLASGRTGEDPISTWSVEGQRFQRDWIGCIDIVKLPDGPYRMYYTGSAVFPQYPTFIQYAESPDGLNWTYQGPITITSSLPYPWWESSETLILPDGTFRMYICYGYGWYADGRRIYQADSADGVAWTLRPNPVIPLGSAGSYDDAAATGPNFVDLGDGTSRMYYTGFDGASYRILSAFSPDGLTWIKEPGARIDVGGPLDTGHAYSPRVLRLSGGEFVMFYTGAGGTPSTSRILSAVSPDGLNWIKEDGARIDPADLPGGIALFPFGVGSGDLIPLDGQYRMYFSADKCSGAPYYNDCWWGRIVAYSAVGTIANGSSDLTPPTVLGLSASPASLWPPNHKMIDVSIDYAAEDPSQPITCSLTVASNEPVRTREKGDEAPDWEIVDPHHVRLRAERLGEGTGRTYTITLTCSDSAGNTAVETIIVKVPHDQGK